MSTDYEKELYKLRDIFQPIQDLDVTTIWHKGVGTLMISDRRKIRSRFFQLTLSGVEDERKSLTINICGVKYYLDLPIEELTHDFLYEQIRQFVYDVRVGDVFEKLDDIVNTYQHSNGENMCFNARTPNSHTWMLNVGEHDREYVLFKVFCIYNLHTKKVYYNINFESIIYTISDIPKMFTLFNLATDIVKLTTGGGIS